MWIMSRNKYSTLEGPVLAPLLLIFSFFGSTFFLFLILFVFLNHFCIQPHCINTVSPGPETVTPEGFFF